MDDFIPQKIGEQYHFLSPSNQVDFDRIRTLMGRYWEIGSSFGFAGDGAYSPLVDGGDMEQATPMQKQMQFLPVFENLAKKKIAFSVIPNFAKQAEETYVAWTAPVNIIAAAKTEPLGPAFPARDSQYRTRFLNVPKFPKEYFFFKPENKNSGLPLIYTSETVKALEGKIGTARIELGRLQPVNIQSSTISATAAAVTAVASLPSEPVQYTTKEGGISSPEQVLTVTMAGTSQKTSSPTMQPSQVLKGFSKLTPSAATLSPLWTTNIKTTTPVNLVQPTGFKIDPQTVAAVTAVAGSEEVQRIKNQLTVDQSALRWSQEAASSNDGAQYEVHNLFLNSQVIGSKEITELNESKMAADGEFETPWKPTKAFQVPLYKVVTKLTNELLEQSVNSTVTYEDYVFNFARPLSKDTVDRMNSGNSRIRYGIADEKCQYSYYLENYERTLGTPAISERIVPNVYAINMVQHFTEKGELNASEWQRVYNPELEYVVTSKGAISQEKVQFKVARNDTEAITQHRKIGRVRKKRGNTNANSAYMDYLEEWRKNQNSSDEAFVEIANDKSQNVIFAAKDYNFIQEVFSKSDNIPMCSKIEFSVGSSIPKSDSIVEVFRKSNCLSLLMIKAMEHSRLTGDPNSLSGDAMATWSNQEFNYFPESLQTTADGSPTEWETTELESVKVPNFDIRSFLDGVINFGVDSSLDTKSEFQYTLIHDGYEMDPFIYKDFRKATHAKLQMNALLINGMMHRLVDKRLRSFSDIMSGKMAATEVVFYEVEKTKVYTNGSREVVQRFWVPNFSGRETIELIDSQVKYDASYQYSVHAWTAIFGNTYRYDTAIGFNQKEMKWSNREKMYWKLRGWPTKKSHEDGWQLGVVNRPTLKLARLPYYEFDAIRIVDNPPIPPQVDIVPFRAVNNKIKINLNASVDDYTVPPIALGASDFSSFVKNYQGQYNALAANLFSDKFVTTGKAEIPLRFKSDDLPKWFEVYRIGFPPRRWKDFEGALHTMLDVESGITSFVDQISPNTQYYYVFRSTDIHGNISNPSNILSVKLVDDQGIFPIIEPYDFEMTEDTSRKFNKQVRRFLQITPVFEQVVYKEERQESEATTIANQRNIRLGVAKDSIYGKRLKFRITSKKSGRKIDLNVSFTHKHLKPPN